MNDIQEHIHAPLVNNRCNYLGLKDDPPTSLAFPSNWNYCQHATPPQSVRLDYQRHYCQTAGFVNCLIYQKVGIGPLPPEIRGRKSKNNGRHKNAIRIIVVLPILTLTLMLLWLGKNTGLATRLGSNLNGNKIVGSLSYATNPLGSPTLRTFHQDHPVIITPPVIGVYPTWTSLSLTHNSSKATVASYNTRTPSQVAICGYKLDTPFGLDIKFLIHQAQGGDSLNLYAEIYDTSVEAIQTVNFRLPIPLRRDWFVVIPLHTTQVSGLPAFEPYLIIDSISSIESFADKFSTDPLALVKYNGLSERCTAISGWVLIPHQKPFR